MTVVALCLEIGAFGDSFAGELAAALGVRLLDLQHFDLSIAELHAFAVRQQCEPEPVPAAIDELSARVTATALQAVAAGDVLIVGWAAATAMAPLSSITRVLVRGPRPRGAWRTVRRFGYEVSGAGPMAVEGSQSLLLRLMRGASGFKRGAPDDFDLVVEAGRLSVHQGRREIVQHIERRGCAAERASHAELARIGAVPTESACARRDWPSLQGCAVAVCGDDVALSGIESQEAAIALVERHLQGGQGNSTPANPLCRKVFD